MSKEQKPADLKRMIEMKKQYESWQKAMYQRWGSPNGQPSAGQFLPFPKDHGKSDVYLEAVRSLQMKEAEHYRNEQLRSKMEDPSKGPPLLSDEELKFLRSKITEFITFSGLDQPAAELRPKESGFSLYGTNDEPGLCGEYDNDQEDYDLDELSNQTFSYGYGPAHQIEVELNDGPARDRGDDNPDEPSCEFTFEYDASGKLVPTYSNVEEKLRLMDLQSQMAQSHSMAPQIEDASHKKKKKGGKKKKKLHEGTCDPAVCSNACLFCQYEAFYGVKPVHMMRWYDQKVMKEEKHRQKVKEKLENAKLRALKRQQGFRPDDAHEDDNQEHTADDESPEPHDHHIPE